MIFRKELLNLIVSTPQSKAGMVADPFDVIDEFRPDICLKFFRQIIHAAGKHEILPDDQSQLIADIPEGVRRIMTAAPDADAVEMSIFRLKQQIAGPLRRHPGQDIVLRNIIRSHGENANPVHLMTEAFSPLVLFPDHSHRPQSDPLLPDVQNLSLPAQLHLHAVQGLVPIAVRPPELRVLDRGLHPARFHLLCSPVRSGHGDMKLHPFLFQSVRILLRSVSSQAVQPFRSQELDIRLKI